MSYALIRAGDRDITSTDWLTSHHSFSFGDHYNPSNTHHGVLVALNEEKLLAGRGFDSHHHQESEIVTWVSSGSLVHRDSAGNSGVVFPGLAQRMSAGSGIDHSERNDPWPSLPGSGTHPARYVQMWIVPDRHGIEPSYEQRDISAQLSTGELIAVASGDPDTNAAIGIANRHATLYAARLPAGTSVSLPAGRFIHLFVVAGPATVDTATVDTATVDVATVDVAPASAHVTAIAAGDSLRGTDTDPVILTAGPGGTEILVWKMDRTLGEQ
ncbi:MAG: pirin family protein [Gordonia sp. (in: high G+C Gram-positive bacteria)]